MENPHEQVQNAILARIINNVERLNESILIINRSLEEINRDNIDLEITSQMWETYQKNVEYNLEATGNMRDPL